MENKVACRVNLKRRGIGIESNLCCLCRRYEESTNHLFCECRVAWLIWNLCYKWLGVRSVDFMDPRSHFEHFKILDAPTSINLIIGNVWIALISEIWRHRNNCLFKGGVVDHTEVFSLAQINVWSWTFSKIPSTNFLFSDWCLESLVICIQFSLL